MSARSHLACSTVLAIVLVVALAGCSRKRYSIPTRSMEPTIPAGSTVVVDQTAYQNADPSRWDIVTFEPPTTFLPIGTGQSVPKQIYLMRVIGLPGETVSFGGEEILINQQPLTVPADLKGLSYLGLAALKVNSPSGKTEFTLGSDEYFVLGDNTTNANDSRFWGPVARDKISGKLISP